MKLKKLKGKKKIRGARNKEAYNIAVRLCGYSTESISKERIDYIKRILKMPFIETDFYYDNLEIDIANGHCSVDVLLSEVGTDET